MDVDAHSRIDDAWLQFEADYRRHLKRHGVAREAADAIVSRMRQHFANADVEFGVWGEMPMPDGVDDKQQAQIVAAFSEVVERMAAEVHEHTRRLLWELFKLETRIELDRGPEAEATLPARRLRH